MCSPLWPPWWKKWSARSIGRLSMHRTVFSLWLRVMALWGDALDNQRCAGSGATKENSMPTFLPAFVLKQWLFAIELSIDRSVRLGAPWETKPMVWDMAGCAYCWSSLLRRSWRESCKWSWWRLEGWTVNRLFDAEFLFSLNGRARKQDMIFEFQQHTAHGRCTDWDWISCFLPFKTCHSCGNACDAYVDNVPAIAIWYVTNARVVIEGWNPCAKPWVLLRTWLWRCIAITSCQGFWSMRQFRKGQADWQQKVLDHLRRLFQKERRGNSKESLGSHGIW